MGGWMPGQEPGQGRGSRGGGGGDTCLGDGGTEAWATTQQSQAQEPGGAPLTVENSAGR